MLNLRALREEQQTTHQKIEQLKSLIEKIINTTTIDYLRDIYEENSVINDIDGLLELLQSDKITISVVAEVSQGKSTFLNALIFRDTVLDSGGGAITARLFKLDYGEQYSITIDNSIEQLASMDELKRAVKKLNKHARNEISSHNSLSKHREDVVITLPDEMLKQGVSLYDTPGFGSTDEKIVYELIEKAISKSDATVLLIDIFQGLKKNEESFIKDVMKAIVPEKRYVVFNKFDDVISEDEQEIKSIEELKEELNKLEQATIQELSKISEIDKNEITTYMLSSRKALAGYKNSKTEKIKESRFDTFEKDFWKKVISTKEKVYEERIKRANNQTLKVQNTITNLRDRLMNEKDEIEKLIVELESQYKLFTSFSNCAKEDLRLIMEQSKKRQREAFDTNELLNESEKIICGQIYKSIGKIGVLDKTKVWSLKDKYIQRVEEALEDSMTLIVPGIESYINNIEKTIFDIQSDINQVVKKINKGLEEYEDYNIEKLDEIDFVIKTDGHIQLNTDSELYKDISIDKEVFVLLSGIISEIVITRLTTLIPGLGLAIATVLTAVMFIYKKYQDPNKKLAEELTTKIMKEFEKKLTETFKDMNEFGKTFNDTLTFALGNYIAKLDVVAKALESPESQQEEIEKLSEQIDELNTYLVEIKSIVG